MPRLPRPASSRERELFDLFERAGVNLVRACALLEQMLDEWPDHEELGRDIVACEHEGDDLTHAVIQRLNGAPTRIDRTDGHQLASALDDVVDLVEEVADFLALYRIEAPMEQAQELARILHRSARAVAAALPQLRSFGDVHDDASEVRRLETEGDQVARQALASLFEHGTDPMLVIRWKDIFERLEDAIDATERAANVLEGIVIRNR